MSKVPHCTGCGEYPGEFVAARIKHLELAVRYEADVAQQALDSRKELEAKYYKSQALLANVDEAQQLLNSYAVELFLYGATISRLRNLEDAWVNLKTQRELAELKGETE